VVTFEAKVNEAGGPSVARAARTLSTS
jgi:hypothetical protein